MLSVLDLADRAGGCLWIDGGWGVDALLGAQTREHGDLDIAIEARHLTAFLEVLSEHGFAAVGEDDATSWHSAAGSVCQSLLSTAADTVRRRTHMPR